MKRRQEAAEAAEREKREREAAEAAAAAAAERDAVDRAATPQEQPQQPQGMKYKAISKFLLLVRNVSKYKILTSLPWGWSSFYYATRTLTAMQ